MSLIDRPWRRAVRCLFRALALLALAPAAWSLCVPPPSSEMQVLDYLAQSDPEHGIAEAKARLQSLSPGYDLLAEAQLLSIIAEALAKEGRARVSGWN